MDFKQQFEQDYDYYGNASFAPNPGEMGGIGLASTNSANNPISPSAFSSGVYQGKLILGTGEIESQNFITGVSGWQIDANGNAEFNDIFIRGVIKTVSTNQSIQDAIDTLNLYGGGEVRLDAGTFTLTSNLVLYSSISLVGAGRDATILEFSSAAFGVQMIGTSGTRKKNIRVKDLTIQNSNATSAIDIQYTNFWQLENVRITSCDQKGIQIQAATSFYINNCRADSNTGNGFDFDATSNGDNERFLVLNCVSDLNSGIGFYLNSTPTNAVQNYNFIGCLSQTNGGDGFDITTSSAASLRGNFVGCVSDQNTGIGFDIDGNSNDINFIDCQAFDNSSDGFESTGNGVTFIGCSGSGNSGGVLYDILGGEGTITGNSFYDTNAPVPATQVKSVDTLYNLVGNVRGSTTTERNVLRMKNTSGGSLALGDVVIIKSATNGDEVTTTTTTGDNKAFGIALAAISNNAYGPILLSGYTKALKVNGTTDIAIGDYLSTYSSAGISGKASAGDTVFAIALEAYTTDDSSGVIDAYILPWRFTLMTAASASEVTTGTDADKYITPDAFAGSDYGKRVVGIQVVDAGTNTATGDAKAFFRVPSVMNGWNLVGVNATVYTAGTTNTTDIQIRNKTDSVDMLSTKMTIDSGETDTSTAATPAVIDTTKDDVATGDVIAIDVDAVHTTPAQGLFVELIFQLP